MAYLANEYDDSRIKIAESANLAENNQAALIRLDHRTRQIEINLKETATELEQLEQYGRRENLEIHGIPINKEESTNQIVKHVATLLKVELTNDQISTSHRLIPNHRRRRQGCKGGDRPPICKVWYCRVENSGNPKYFSGSV